MGFTCSFCEKVYPSAHQRAECELRCYKEIKAKEEEEKKKKLEDARVARFDELKKMEDEYTKKMREYLADYGSYARTSGGGSLKDLVPSMWFGW